MKHVAGWLLGWCAVGLAVAVVIGKAFGVCDDMDRLTAPVRTFPELSDTDVDRLLAAIERNY